MKLTYFGHSAFRMEGKGFDAVIDPFLPNGIPFDPSNLTHIFVTHGHADHLGSTLELAKMSDAVVVANFELSAYLQSKGARNVHSMHIGGRFENFKMTPAHHGSSIFEDGKIIYAGNPCGFVIETDGIKVYHAGDTGLSYDMKLLEDEGIDIALLPIGGNYTMDVKDAIRAIGFIKPKMVIPMHYDTFDIIKANPHELEGLPGVEIKILAPTEYHSTD